MQPLLLSHFTATICIGTGLEATLSSLRAQRSGLRPCDFESVTLETWIGAVDAADSEVMRQDLRAFD